MTERGELVLCRSGAHFEIISNGVFLMDTRAGESERLLARAALDGRDGQCRVLIGGLGVGFTVAEALRHPACGTVTVVEIEPAILTWQQRHLAALAGHPLSDPRVRVVQADLIDWLAGDTDRYDVICVDIDNGPQWTVTESNSTLYGARGLELIAGRLAEEGTVAVWSAAADPGFAVALSDRFGNLRTLRLPVARGEPDVVYLAGG